MEQVKITFPDGAVKEFDKGVTTEDIAASISPGLKKKAVAGKLNDIVVDLLLPITEDAKVEIVTLDSKEGLVVYRHSTAHLMAQALKRLYPDIKLGIGPVIENGFYYDVDMEHVLKPEDLLLIEKEMKKIINENVKFERKVVVREEALRIYKEIDDHLKIELIEELPEGEEISIYEQGEFFDLCRGPHLPSTSKIKALKLMSIAGAYWRGNSDNQMLQRIYGTAFPKQAQLDEYLHFIEEAQKRDHRKLGKELELFMFSEESPGMPFYLQKGQIIRTELEDFSRDLQRKAGYDEVRTPFMMN